MNDTDTAREPLNSRLGLALSAIFAIGAGEGDGFVRRLLDKMPESGYDLYDWAAKLLGKNSLMKLRSL